MTTQEQFALSFEAWSGALAQIVDATFQELYDRSSGIVYDDETTELVAEMEIEANNTVGDYPYVWTVKACGWYVFLWQYSAHDTITAYSVDEICMQCGYLSFLPLQTINGRRICIDCAGYSEAQIRAIHDAESLKHREATYVYLKTHGLLCGIDDCMETARIGLVASKTVLCSNHTRDMANMNDDNATQVFGKDKAPLWLAAWCRQEDAMVEEGYARLLREHTARVVVR